MYDHMTFAANFGLLRGLHAVYELLLMFDIVCKKRIHFGYVSSQSGCEISAALIYHPTDHRSSWFLETGTSINFQEGT